MSILFTCPACSRSHASRLQARRDSRFHDVVPQFGEILEVCPATGRWVSVGYADMTWQEDPGPVLSWT